MEFLKTIPEFNEINSSLQALFDETELASLAASHNFIQKPRELTAIGFVQMCIRGVMSQGYLISLTELNGELAQQDIFVVNQSLNEQFSSAAVSFMEAFYNQLLLNKLQYRVKIDTLSYFSGVYLRDATHCSLPAHLKDLFKGYGGDGSDANLKIDFCIDIVGNDYRICFRDATQTDVTVDMGPLKAGALYLRDLGYYKLKHFRAIQEADAFFVSRFKYGTNIYEDSQISDSLNLEELLSTLKKEGASKSLPIYLGRKERLPCRLVIQKLPTKVAAEKRRKLKKEQHRLGRTPSKSRLLLCDFNIYITNLAETDWSNEQVVQLYRIRWQIEIIFKVWKSIFKLGKVAKMKAERFLCLLYGHICWLIINMKLFQCFKAIYWNSYQKEISELKGYKILYQMKENLLYAIFKHDDQYLLNVLKQCWIILGKIGKKQDRGGQANPLFYIEKNIT